MPITYTPPQGSTPQYTTAQINALPPPSYGLIVYDTDIGNYFKWDINTSTWLPLN